MGALKRKQKQIKYVAACMYTARYDPTNSVFIFITIETKMTICWISLLTISIH